MGSVALEINKFLFIFIVIFENKKHILIKEFPKNERGKKNRDNKSTEKCKCGFFTFCIWHMITWIFCSNLASIKHMFSEKNIGNFHLMKKKIAFIPGKWFLSLLLCVIYRANRSSCESTLCDYMYVVCMYIFIYY